MDAEKSKILIREARLSDYEGLVGLWLESGIPMKEGDDIDGIRRLLMRNPGLSVVAMDGDEIVGSVLGTWDGRRGWLIHLAVAESHRRQDIASVMVSRVESAMLRLGVSVVKAEIYSPNIPSRSLFEKIGYKQYGGLTTVGKRLQKINP